MRARIYVAVVTVAVTCALPVQPLTGASTQRRTRQPHVYFVPIGIDASLLRLHSTAGWFRESLGLDVVVADRVEPADAYDANRGQFVAERLAGQLATLRRQVIAMKSATVIGITDRDM